MSTISRGAIRFKSSTRRFEDDARAVDETWKCPKLQGPNIPCRVRRGPDPAQAKGREEDRRTRSRVEAGGAGCRCRTCAKSAVGA